MARYSGSVVVSERHLPKVVWYVELTTRFAYKKRSSDYCKCAVRVEASALADGNGCLLLLADREQRCLPGPRAKDCAFDFELHKSHWIFPGACDTLQLSVWY